MAKFITRWFVVFGAAMFSVGAFGQTYMRTGPVYVYFDSWGGAVGNKEQVTQVEIDGRILPIKAEFDSVDRYNKGVCYFNVRRDLGLPGPLGWATQKTRGELVFYNDTGREVTRAAHTLVFPCRPL